MNARITLMTVSLLLMASSNAMAQAWSIDWYTIDGGGGASAGGDWSMTGAIGQADAGSSMTGGTLEVEAGFWVVEPVATCFPDCNKDGVLNILDFVCFQNAFQAQDPFADCNDDGLLNILDFVCFQNEFSNGCG